MVNYPQEVRDLQFRPFVYGGENQQIPVSIKPVTRPDVEWYCRRDSEEERFYETFFRYAGSTT